MMDIEKRIREDICDYFTNKRNFNLEYHSFGYGVNTIYVYPLGFFKCNPKWNPTEIAEHILSYRIKAGGAKVKRQYQDWIIERILPIIVENLIKYNKDSINVVFRQTVENNDINDAIVVVYVDGDFEYSLI